MNDARDALDALGGKELDLTLPLTAEVVETLVCGDVVYLTGTLFTGRDMVHKRLVEYRATGKAYPFDLAEMKGSVVFHCGPVIRGLPVDPPTNIAPSSPVLDEVEFISSGPTTSQRVAPLIAEVVNLTGIRGVVGKGGIDPFDSARLGCVYFSFPGGAGVVAATKIARVLAVYWLDLGIPEALWVLEVDRFGPLLVTQDVQSRNWYKALDAASRGDRP